MSEEGPDVTIIDIENGGRGMAFLSGETSAAKVDGFTFRRGTRRPTTSGEGLPILGADPTFVKLRRRFVRGEGLQTFRPATAGGLWGRQLCVHVHQLRVPVQRRKRIRVFSAS